LAATPIHGVLHDARTQRSLRVEVDFDSARRAVHARGENLDLFLPEQQLKVERGGFRGDVVHLLWLGAAGSVSITLEDRDQVEAFCERASTTLADQIRSTRGRKPSAAGRIFAAALLLALLLPIALIVFVVQNPDPLVGWIVDRIPPSVEKAIGGQVEREISARAITGGPLSDALSRITAELSKGIQDPPFEMRFFLVPDATCNAFAAPGGVIAVHTGLLAQAESPEEVAGVLAHEIGHVLLRHSLRQMVYRAGLWSAIRLLLSGADSWVLGGAEMLTALSYSREDEGEADGKGLEILEAAGIDPEGLVRFFERTADNDPLMPALLSTHPTSEGRARRLRELSAGLPSPAPLDWGLDWPAVREQARAAR